MKNIKFKLFIAVLLFVCSINYVYAQTIEFNECEYSEQYKKWLLLSDAEKAKIPAPVKCASISKSYGNPVTIPSRYNLVDENLVMRMEDQNAGNTCWAFAATESMESNYLKRGNTGIELSQAHIELMTQNTHPIDGWKTFSRAMDDGGSDFIASAYVLNYWGPILSSDLEYQRYIEYLNDSSTINLNSLKNKKPVLDVDNVVFIFDEQGACSNETIKTIKEYILTNGAITAGVNFDYNVTEYVQAPNGAYNEVGDYINGPYFYYNGTDIANHAVTIVGWDDSIDASNFSSQHRPSRNGAWIIKNSYGEIYEYDETHNINMGDAGYYYVSYDDINVCTDLGGYYNVDSKVSDNAYFYDYLGITNYFASSANDVFLANKFEKKTSDNEKIDKITFATSSSNQKYDVYYSSTGSLNSYKKIASGTSEGRGYMSVVPNETISLSDNFAIIVELKDDNVVPFAFKTDSQDDDYYDYEIPSNVSYVSVDGTNWTESETSGIKLLNSIRVYTTKTSAPQTPSSGEQTTTPSGKEPEVQVTTNEDGTSASSQTTTTDSVTTTSEEKTEVENPKTGVSFPVIVALVGIVVVIAIKVVSKKKNKFERV